MPLDTQPRAPHPRPNPPLPSTLHSLKSTLCDEVAPHLPELRGTGEEIVKLPAIVLTREELLGHPIQLLTPESIRAMHPALSCFYFNDLTTRQMAAELAMNGRYRDGSEFPIQIHLSPLETEMGLFALAWITPRHADEDVW